MSRVRLVGSPTVHSLRQTPGDGNKAKKGPLLTCNRCGVQSEKLYPDGACWRHARRRFG